MDRNRTTTQREMPHQVFISDVPPDPSSPLSPGTHMKLCAAVLLFVIGFALAASGVSAIVHVVVHASR